jgi:hypothetical protein
MSKESSSRLKATITKNDKGGIDVRAAEEVVLSQQVEGAEVPTTYTITTGFKQPIPRVAYSNMEVSVTVTGGNRDTVLQDSTDTALTNFINLYQLLANNTLEQVAQLLNVGNDD